ncbi:MAG: NAD-dependent epimerase [Bacteroidales bacterium]|nr:NAD-dependent epimerase [Bacteroidales bacterium]
MNLPKSKNKPQKILITGTAGFIGFHLTKRLLERGNIVVGLDSINDYYDVRLKYARLAETGITRDLEYASQYQSSTYKNYNFIKLKLEDKENIQQLFESGKFDKVVNLAAQAGVRYSIENPHAYIDSNIIGFMNILEGCRHNNVKHLVYASSSSVYGLNKKMPLSTSDNVDHPISLYAATKKSNELMAHTYSHLYNIPTTGLRFFTVYGPWGRPDMALFLFTKAILEDNAIDVYNYGNMVRDFTYVDDIVEGILRVIDNAPILEEQSAVGSRQSADKNMENHIDLDPSTSPTAPYSLYNIGNSSPVKLMDFIDAIEETLGKKAKKNMREMQPGDVPETHADVSALIKNLEYKPDTPIKEGVRRFVEWYKEYYKV